MQDFHHITFLLVLKLPLLVFLLLITKLLRAGFDFSTFLWFEFDLKFQHSVNVCSVKTLSPHSSVKTLTTLLRRHFFYQLFTKNHVILFSSIFNFIQFDKLFIFVTNSISVDTLYIYFLTAPLPTRSTDKLPVHTTVSKRRMKRHSN